MPENASRIFQLADFGFADSRGGHMGDDDTGAEIEIGAIQGEDVGSLNLLIGSPMILGPGDFVSAKAIETGELIFTTMARVSGAKASGPFRFTFHVWDNGVPEAGVYREKPSPRTLTIQVEATHGAGLAFTTAPSAEPSDEMAEMAEMAEHEAIPAPQDPVAQEDDTAKPHGVAGLQGGAPFAIDPRLVETLSRLPIGGDAPFPGFHAPAAREGISATIQALHGAGDNPPIYAGLSSAHGNTLRGAADVGIVDALSETIRMAVPRDVDEPPPAVVDNLLTDTAAATVDARILPMDEEPAATGVYVIGWMGDHPGAIMERGLILMGSDAANTDDLVLIPAECQFAQENRGSSAPVHFLDWPPSSNAGRIGRGKYPPPELGEASPESGAGAETTVDIASTGEVAIRPMASEFVSIAIQGALIPGIPANRRGLGQDMGQDMSQSARTPEARNGHAQVPIAGFYAADSGNARSFLRWGSGYHPGRFPCQV